MIVKEARQEHLLSVAYKVAQDSPDPSTQVGALLYSIGDRRIISWGCNEFPAGLEVTPERLERPLKYTFIEHAERNAIFGVVSQRIACPSDTIMVGTWAACADCARAIVQAGIKVLVRHDNINDHAPDHWKESVSLADEILEAGGVTIIDYRGTVPADPIRHNGMMWNPRTLTLEEA